MSADISGYHDWAEGCCCHLVGRRQGCYRISHKIQDSPTTKNYLVPNGLTVEAEKACPEHRATVTERPGWGNT